MILAGELQFYQLQKSWLKQKIQARTGFEILTGWCCKLSFKATRYEWGKFWKIHLFLVKTYAFCKEVNQIEPWQTQVSWNFSAITEQSTKKGEKGSFLYLLGVTSLPAFIFLFFNLCFQHFRCIENCLSLPICYIFFGLVLTIIFKYC